MTPGKPLFKNGLLFLVIILVLVTDTGAWRRRRRDPPPPPPPPPDTTPPTFTLCPGNLGNQYTTSSTRSISWSTPTATDNRGAASVSITAGSGSGSTFAAGGHSTTYTATDGAGNRATCIVSYTVVVIRCAALPRPSNGGVSCTNSVSVGSACTYSCNTGYRRGSGSATQTCTQSGNSAYWSGSATVCTRITCPGLSNPSNGRVTCTDGSYYNSRCTYSCNAGYTLQRGAPRVCSVSGAWSGSNPSCTDITNPVFTRCPSSQTVYAPNLATTATVTWSNPTASDSTGRAVSLSKTQGAASGSSFLDGVHVIIYTARDAAGNTATCSFSVTIHVIHCRALSAATPLHVTCPHGNIRGATCSYSCQLGYRLQGQGSTGCQKSGSSGAWSNAPPSCQILQCPTHSAPAHGTVVGTCSTSYGSTCRFSCNLGYEINNAQRRCTVQAGSTNAFWEGSSPVCTRIQCRKPVLSNALQITTSADCPRGDYVPSGNQCRFLCSAGYYLVGNTALTCQHERTWSHTTPTCQRISCTASSLPAPSNGVKRGCSNNREDYGTVCTLACNVGYTPSNAVQRTCSDDGDGDGDGVWAGDNLICSIVMCPILPAPNDGQITTCLYQGASQSIMGRQKYRTTCSLGCDAGFTKTGGSSARVCQANGNWDGQQAVCEDNTAPVFTCPPDKTLVAGALSTAAPVPWLDWEPIMGTDRRSPLHADLYTIDSSMVGAVKPQSLDEGQHTVVYRGIDLAGNAATCSFNIQVQVTRCPPLPIPDHGSASLSPTQGRCEDGALLGASCRVTCANGYRLSTGANDLTRTCRRTSDTAVAGYWSEQHEICNVKNCTVPAVTNGFASDCQTAKVAYQTLCDFQCNPGYTTPSGVEAVERTCRADETWSGLNLQCTVTKTCLAMFNVPHGSVAPPSCGTEAVVRFGSTCEFSCNEGFQLQGPATLACSTEGEWNTAQRPICQDVQPPTFTIQCPHQVEVFAEQGTLSATVVYGEPVASDNSGQVNITRMDNTLGPGSSFAEGDTTIGYLATDSSGLTSRCDVVITVRVRRCSSQQPPPHGSVQGCQDPFYGSQCNFSCDVGYDLIGQAQVSCDLSADGNPAWSHDRPVCQIRTCPALVIQALATLSGCDSSDSVPYGTVCTFHCPVGYEGMGESEKRCQADRSWSSTDFICQRKSCPPLAATDEISIAPASCRADPRFEDRCNLACRNPGYEIDPPRLRETVCSAQQTWTAEISLAQCTDVQAPSFDHCPENIVTYAERRSNQTLVQWQVLASDNSGNDPTVTCDLSPGVMTSGSYSVTCTARDDTGNEAVCRFDVDVLVRKCSRELQPPLFGTLVGSCDTSYGSICQVTCLVGYSLVGSPEASCEFNGTDMYWQTDDEPYCQVIGCDPLTVDESVIVLPSGCTTSEKVHAGTVCTIHCNRDRTLSGQLNMLTCLASGRWDSNETELAALRCLDYRGPVITSCPSEPIEAVRTEFWGLEVTFDIPMATDNWDDNLTVKTTPPDLTSPYNVTEDTTCVYTFTDGSNNSATCVFDINIINEVRPVVRFCPPGQNITTSTKLTDVGWEEPEFLPAPGTELIETCNYGNNPASLPWGNHVILYRASDKGSGLRAECRININITPVSCQDLDATVHGAIACDDGFAYGRYCTMVCNEDYDIPRLRANQVPPEIFICGASGLWYPNANVPDCSRRRNPRRMNLPLSLMYYSGTCASNSDDTRQTISQKFVDIVSQSHFSEICTKNAECTVDHVNVVCGAEERRKKRSTLVVGEKEDNFVSENVTFVSMVIAMASSSADCNSSKPIHQYLVDLANHMHRHIYATVHRDEDVATHGPTPLETKLLYDDISMECHEGYVPARNGLSCVACPLGHFFDQSDLECYRCEQGTYQDEPGQSRCKPCVKGTSTREKGARHTEECEVECVPGHVSESGFVPCVPCTEGWFQPMTGQTECFQCPEGLTTMEGSSSIQDCKEPCPPGQFSKSGLQPCTQCRPGTYQPLAQQRYCRRCGGDNINSRGNNGSRMSICRHN